MRGKGITRGRISKGGAALACFAAVNATAMAVNSDAAIPWPYSRPHDMPWDTEAGAGCLEWARACAMSPGTTYTYQLRAACAIAVFQLPTTPPRANRALIPPGIGRTGLSFIHSKGGCLSGTGGGGSK